MYYEINLCLEIKKHNKVQGLDVFGIHCILFLYRNGCDIQAMKKYRNVL